MLPTEFKNSKKGTSIYFAIIILSILLAIVLGLSTILIGQIRIIKGMGDSVASFYGADTGIERVLYQDKLCRQAGCGGLGWLCADTDMVPCNEGISSAESPLSDNVGIGGAFYRASFNNGATSITSRGSYNGTWRAVQVDR